MERSVREHLELWERLVRTHAGIVAQLEAEMESDQDLSLRWYEVMLHLTRAPEGQMRMQDLAAVSLQSKSGLTRLVDRMEAAGLVTRQSCPSDRRGVFAAITPAGRRRFKRAAPLHVRGIERHFGRHLAEGDSSALTSVLERLQEGRAREGPGP
jgi:DNA-binding MarR family transcriptional regulator